ncbi:MAG: sulfatase [Verrucomicrobiota bacterium]
MLLTPHRNQRLRHLFALFFAYLLSAAIGTADDRPNILWIVVDDMSANLSCYGETTIETPHLDKLAARGTLFSKAFVTAPVCSTNRSAFITGMYQTTIGAHHHRSGRGEMKIKLPEGVLPIPALFKEAGYYTAITAWPNGRTDQPGKTDYNFNWDRAIYDGPDWTQRKPGQPFFAQIMLPGGKHRGKDLASFTKLSDRVEKSLGSRTNPEEVTLPPYYPNDPVLLADWASYLDTVRLTDYFVGKAIKRLEKDGDLENTVVVFITDHGISHARGKQFLYEEGLHVPLIIAGPGIEKNATRSDLVEHIDIAALSLGLAGIPIPDKMQAKDLLAKDYQKRDYVFSARDRCDETVDHIRSVRSDRYKYIRNYYPNRPLLQPNRYKDAKDIIIALRVAQAERRLNAKQKEVLFAPTRAPEELYDLEKDPHELNNLAYDPEHHKTLKKLRKTLDQWIAETGDQGPETEAMYDSEMAVYLNPKRLGQEQYDILMKNIALMKSWAHSGK